MSTAFHKQLKSISVLEFAHRFTASVTEHTQSYVWFVGAGCSISSGIPAASGLVHKWLDEMHGFEPEPRQARKEWLARKYPDRIWDTAGQHYAQVFNDRHFDAKARQSEIEKLCGRGEPAYGYATFAQLLSHDGFGRQNNIIMTTNFDDLVADALYLYGDRHARPQVITHEALARYIWPGSRRPVIVKLHGDAFFDPRNLSSETSQLDQNMVAHMSPILHGRGLVFVGYGGFDASVLRFLQSCEAAHLKPPVYWIGETPPADGLVDWLIYREAVRVTHTDFDELMHYLRGQFSIDHPSKQRFEAHFEIMSHRVV